MLIADTHVHAYPGYDANVWWSSAFRNLRRLAPPGVPAETALLLTERHDCSFFREVSSGHRPVPPGFTLVPVSASGVVSVIRSSEPSDRLWLFAGRQVVTRDGIEVLALLTDAAFPDRVGTEETVAAVRAAGGLPVLPWSPGKWLGRRGGVVRSLIASAAGQPLAVGDVAMRPYGFPESPRMREARARGLPVLAGSDPLPFAGDAESVGRYAVRVEAFDASAPAESLKRALLAGRFAVAGRRDTLPRAARRWLANQRARKGAA